MYIKENNFTNSTDAQIIISSSDKPSIVKNRIKDNAGPAIEIGQAGDRSFVGVALNGTTKSYEIKGNIIERNYGGVLCIGARGGVVESDFESYDDGGRGAYHVDFTGTGTAVAGDWFGVAQNCTFSSGNTHGNIKTRQGSKLFHNTHSDGNPCINNASDTSPLYAPFENFISGATAKYASTGKGGIITQLGFQTFTLRAESVADGSNGIQVSPTFTLDAHSLLMIAAGSEDSTNAVSTGYDWYLRNVTNGAIISTFQENLSWNTGSIASNDWLNKVSHRSSDNDVAYTIGDKYAIYFRNNSGGGVKVITGFCTVMLLPH